MNFRASQFMHAMQGTFNTREHGKEGEEGAIDKTRGTAEAGMAAILGKNPNMYTLINKKHMN